MPLGSSSRSTRRRLAPPRVERVDMERKLRGQAHHGRRVQRNHLCIIAYDIAVRIEGHIELLDVCTVVVFTTACSDGDIAKA